MSWPFTKMHGAGNDFVLLDATATDLPLDRASAARIGDRRRGVGCDQLLRVRRSSLDPARFAYDIYNGDGSPAAQCGNGARCVVAWLVQHQGLRLPAVLDSPAGPVVARQGADGQFEVVLGSPRFGVAAWPGLLPDPAGALPLEVAGRALLGYPVDLGNPHLVLRVDAIEQAEVALLGAALNADPRLPGGVNVGFVQVLGADRLALRVYERGAGETLACGSGACAAAAVAIRQGWCSARRLQLQLPGGTLAVHWPDAGAELALGGPVAFVYDGRLAAAFLHPPGPSA